MKNQLKNEQSPYLKQHKDNPVNWFAWKKESLEKAKSEKKPIFLSAVSYTHLRAHETSVSRMT